MNKHTTSRRLLPLLFAAGALTALVPVASAQAQTASPGCHPRAERSVSIGVYLGGELRTMSYCYTGDVEDNVLAISGRSVDDATSGLCARAITRFTTRSGGVTIPHPLNCSGGSQPIDFRSSGNVEQVVLRVCAVDASSGRVVTCSGANQVYPAVGSASTFGRR